MKVSENQEKILSLIKPYAISTIDDPNTENMVISLVLGASEFRVEDKVISILENTNNYGISFESIAEKIYSLFPNVEYTDNEEENENF